MVTRRVLCMHNNSLFVDKYVFTEGRRDSNLLVGEIVTSCRTVHVLPPCGYRYTCLNVSSIHIIIRLRVTLYYIYFPVM